MPFDLDLSQANPLLANVRSVFSPGVADAMLLNAGMKVGVAAEALVSPYPPASGNPLPLYYTRQRKDGTTYQSKFKSLAQQRAVMGKVAKGLVPYRRTGQLGKSIVSKAMQAGGGLVIVSVGSNLTYAPYVIDLQMQSHYHMGTWTPIQTDIENGLDSLQAVAVKSIVNDVNRRVNGNG